MVNNNERTFFGCKDREIFGEVKKKNPPNSIDGLFQTWRFAIVKTVHAPSLQRNDYSCARNGYKYHPIQYIFVSISSNF